MKNTKKWECMKNDGEGLSGLKRKQRELEAFFFMVRLFYSIHSPFNSITQNLTLSAICNTSQFGIIFTCCSIS